MSLSDVRTCTSPRRTGQRVDLFLLLLVVLSVLVAGALVWKQPLHSAVRQLVARARHAFTSPGFSTNSAAARLILPSIEHTTDSVVVDLAPRRTIPPGFFGINYSAFWDDAQGSAASARALAQTPIKTVRFAGGDPGDWYDWQ